MERLARQTRADCRPTTSGRSDAGSRPIARQCTSRRSMLLLSAPGLLLLPDVGQSLRNEASLWQQELQLYGRKATEAVKESLGAQSHEPGPPPRAVDPGFAALLLDAPIAALRSGSVLPGGWDEPSYRSQYDALLRRELPYFEQRGACGHCGKEEDPQTALADGLWVDAQSYLQFKTLSAQVAEAYDSPEEQAAAAERLRIAIGGIMLQAAQDEASARGDTSSAAALAVDSVELDSIRRGVRAVLGYFRDQGYVSDCAVVFFGASKNEERNHYVWSVGEPAYLKYWLREPLLERSGRALRAEEGGMSQDYIAATVQAYLLRCGVACSDLRHFPSLTHPGLEAQQWTLRRRRDLPPGYDYSVYDPFQTDPCPADAAISSACY